MTNLYPYIFWFVALIHISFYTVFRNDIFEWDADPNSKNRENLALKRKIIKGEMPLDKPPLAWTIERYIHVFLSVSIGWAFFCILLSRADVFCKPNFSHLDFSDLVLFLLGWIGVNGRLPSIAHAIVDFMKSGVSIGPGK